jgi:hypothetical protein
MSIRLNEEVVVGASGRLVNTPCWLWPTLVFSTHSPPISTVISCAVSVSSYALSTSNASAGMPKARFT